jgi:hypothetical protein
MASPRHAAEALPRRLTWSKTAEVWVKCTWDPPPTLWDACTSPGEVTKSPVCTVDDSPARVAVPTVVQCVPSVDS